MRPCAPAVAAAPLAAQTDVMRLSRIAWGCALLTILCGCTYPLGGDRPAGPAPDVWPCRPASERAIAAVDAVIPQQGALAAAQMVSVTTPDGAYRHFPNYVLAARFVTLTDESEVGVWAMGQPTTFSPVYPLNLAAIRLTAPDARPDSGYAVEMAPMAQAPPALAVLGCVAGSG